MMPCNLRSVPTSFLFLLFLLSSLVVTGQNETNYAFLQQLKSEELISQKSFEWIEKRKSFLPKYHEYWRFLKEVRKILDENYPDYKAFEPGIREASGVYWIKHKGNPPTTPSHIPPKPEELNKYARQVKRLSQIFRERNLISQSTSEKIEFLIKSSIILHPHYLLEAIAQSVAIQDMTSQATIEKLTEEYKDAIVLKSNFNNTLAQAKNGSLNLPGLLNSMGSFEEIKYCYPKSAEDAFICTSKILFSVSMFVSSDSFSVKKDTFNYDDSSTPLITSRLFFHFTYNKISIKIEYPVNDGTPSPYAGFKDFVHSVTFTNLVNSIACDAHNWGRVLIVDTNDLTEKALKSNGFEGFNDKYFNILPPNPIAGLWYLKTNSFEEVYSTSIWNAETDLGLAILFKFPMDGFDTYIKMTKKMEVFKRMEEGGVFLNKRKIEIDQLRNDCATIPFSDPVIFLEKLSLGYELEMSCMSAIRVLYSKEGNPHEYIFYELKRLTNNEFNPADFASERDEKQVIKISFKVNGQSFEYSIPPFSSSTRPCAHFLNIAADCIKKTNPNGRNFYSPIGYYPKETGGVFFYLSKDEVALFKELFGLQMQPFAL